ncbi:hypothetical protein EJ06DRAFT_533429 [Trichodelitschia bisporula]|uniref:Uncharacterized protein n=1 Tax=Trichodelitschia bisporula TaxID=703511 RepID=A0A6G1HN15_9PEZI|nr:hypothetical protein EJ06DRAFT_533429 [Trichodelitschia bisporula]
MPKATPRNLDQEALRCKEVWVKPVGAQKGSERFPRPLKAGDRSFKPLYKPWRLNLTALSHVYNLYFLAEGHLILVYQPNYPEQTLPKVPLLRILLPKSPDWLLQYDDGRDFINHLVVTFLGNIEVLIVTCDNGDVMALYTHCIQHEMVRDMSRRNRSAWLKPFFCRNVGMSAWGIAVHTRARKIAVSSNTTHVTVFSLGLSLKEHSPSDFKLLLVDRPRDEIVRLGRVGDNIPAIAFCNTPDDPYGQYLMAGDILGRFFMWDLHSGSGTPVDHKYVWFCPDQVCDCPVLSHSVWSIAFLDPRAFIPTPGFHPPRGVDWNASVFRHFVPDSSTSHKITKSSHGLYPGTNRYSLNPDQVKEYSEWRGSSRNPFTFSASHLWEHSREFVTHKKLHVGCVRPIGSHPTQPPRVPIFVSSDGDTFLLQSPSQLRANTSPIVQYHNPLAQVEYLPPDDDYPDGEPTLNAHMQRLPFQACISELGILLVGNPSGRVGLWALGKAEDGTFFKRLDWILPLKSQEEAGQRPEAWMVGMAVGPLQGSLQEEWDGRSPRRWRVIMEYSDGGWLAYEIGRKLE